MYVLTSGYCSAETTRPPAHCAGLARGNFGGCAAEQNTIIA
jgi:hypothetical protein